MKIAPILLVALSLTPVRFAQAPAAPTGSDPLVLRLAAHFYRGDQPAPGPGGNGTMGPLLHESEVSGFIWLMPTLCGVFSSANEPKGTEKAGATSYNTAQHIPGSGWRVSARVLERNGDTFKVRVEWERRWDKSTRLTSGPTGTQEITLRAGEPFALDRVEPTLTSECGMTAARLEVTIAPRQAVKRSSSEPVGALTPIADTSYDAEVSLVFAKPDGKEDVQRRNLRLGASPSPFRFSTISIPFTDEDVIRINVQGAIRPMATTAGDVWLQLEIDRSVTAPPGFVPGPSGVQMKRIPLPASPEPVTIELPALFSSSRDRLAGHALALRIRILTKK